jgi:hypothetical protein
MFKLRVYLVCVCEILNYDFVLWIDFWLVPYYDFKVLGGVGSFVSTAVRVYFDAEIDFILFGLCFLLAANVLVRPWVRLH